VSSAECSRPDTASPFPNAAGISNPFEINKMICGIRFALRVDDEIELDFDLDGSERGARRTRIVVSIPDRKAALVAEDGPVVKVYPVAVGARRSPSPTGEFEIVNRIPKHRIFVFPLQLPPLRQRCEDIPMLVEHFARQVADQNSWKPAMFTPGAVEELQAYSWPGDVRELRNAVERLLLLAGRVEAFEREALLAELRRHNYHMTETAKALGLERSHLYKKCQQLGIDLRSLRGGV
jgi:hypothetical protein